LNDARFDSDEDEAGYESADPPPKKAPSRKARSAATRPVQPIDENDKESVPLDLTPITLEESDSDAVVILPSASKVSSKGKKRAVGTDESDDLPDSIPIRRASGGNGYKDGLGELSQRRVEKEKRSIRKEKQKLRVVDSPSPPPAGSKSKPVFRGNDDPENPARAKKKMRKPTSGAQTKKPSKQVVDSESEGPVVTSTQPRRKQKARRVSDDGEEEQLKKSGGRRKDKAEREGKSDRRQQKDEEKTKKKRSKKPPKDTASSSSSSSSESSSESEAGTPDETEEEEDIAMDYKSKLSQRLRRILELPANFRFFPFGS